MIRSLAALLMLMLVSVRAEAVSLADVKKQGTVKVVITSSSPPHGFLDAKTNSMKGIMFEVAQAIAADWASRPSSPRCRSARSSRRSRPSAQT